MSNACPRCGALLAPFSHGGVTMSLCPSCKGMWFDAGELKRMLGAEPPALGAPASLDLEGGTPSPPCPRCAVPLISRRLAEDAALAVESCRKCGGMFLDRGELDRVRRLARRPRHLAPEDRRAFVAAVPDPRARRKIQTSTWKRIRAFTTAPPRARAQWHTFSTDGAGLMLLYLLGLPTEEENPKLTRFPFVLYTLIAVNLACWVGQLLGPGGPVASVHRFALVPGELFEGHGYTLLTSMFIHGSWVHVLGNLYFLWLFGDNVEDRLGPVRFLLLYLTAGVAAGLAQVFATSDPTLPILGASGAIAGVMAAYMLLFPGSRIMTVFVSVLLWALPIAFFISRSVGGGGALLLLAIPFLFPLLFRAFVVPVPAWLYLAFWVGLNALHAWLGTPGVAWWAHIVGFGVGFAIAGLSRIASGPAPDTGPRPAVAR